MPLTGGTPVYQLCLCDRKGDAQEGRLSSQFFEELQEPADVATVGEGGYCKGEVVHIRDHQPAWDAEM